MAVSKNVVLLGITSFLADVSGEIIIVMLPFALLAQGATGLALGLVGAAEAVQYLFKPLAGWLADRTSKRKPLIVAGYAAPPLARIGIALATSPLWIAIFRGADRAGKGVRAAPRDALLAESVAPEHRGRAFGFHRAADTAGALVGVLLAFALITWSGWSATSIVLLGAFLGLLTLAPLVFVRDIEGATKGRRTFEAASPRYRAYLLVAGVFALGNLAILFVIIRGASAAGGAGGAILLYLLYNVIYVAAAYPAGALADRWGKPRVLAVGFALSAVGFALLVPAPSLPLAIAAFAVLGLAVGSISGVERAYAADLAGSEGRSTRLGVFQSTVGLAGVAGGLVAGALWDAQGPAWTFGAAATLCVAALGLLAALGFLHIRGDSVR